MWQKRELFCKHNRKRDHIQKLRLCCCSSYFSWHNHLKKLSSLQFFQIELFQYVDINECDVMPGLCDGGMCVNTDGSFVCDCPKGFKHDRNTHQCVGKLGNFLLEAVCAATCNFFNQ